MKAVEDGKRQRDADYQRPGGEAVEIQLDGRRLHLLHLERVDDPESEVGDQKKGDQLPSS